MDKGNTVVDDFLNIHRTMCPNYKSGFNNLVETYKYILGENYETHDFRNNQKQDYEQFIGYVKSLSYTLNEKDSNYNEYMLKLKQLFEKYNKDNLIEFPMTTTITYGYIK